MRCLGGSETASDMAPLSSTPHPPSPTLHSTTSLPHCPTPPLHEPVCSVQWSSPVQQQPAPHVHSQPIHSVTPPPPALHSSPSPPLPHLSLSLPVSLYRPLPLRSPNVSAQGLRFVSEGLDLTSSSFPSSPPRQSCPPFPPPSRPPSLPPRCPPSLPLWLRPL